MRIILALAVVSFFGIYAQGQDAGMQAAQQANAAGIQAAQQANDMAMQASQQAAQNAQAAQAQASQSSQFTYPVAARPRFSVKGGTYSSPVTVKLRDSARGAVIYYTTDGWTPTTSSTRYTGPITISSTTTLQAMAILPQLPLSRSRLATASYKISGTQAKTQTADSTPKTLGLPKPMLPRGMAVHLVFASDVSSRTADVGDKIAFTLADDIKVGDRILAKKGTPVVGTITEADKARSFGRPGEVFFQVDYLKIDGTTVKLTGSAALEGHDKLGTAIGLAAIPPGIGGFLTHGDEAEIASGTPFVATVDADTPFSPAN